MLRKKGQPRHRPARRLASVNPTLNRPFAAATVFLTTDPAKFLTIRPNGGNSGTDVSPSGG